MTSTGRRVRAGQLIVAEVVVVGAIGAYRGPGWLFLGVLVVAAGVLVATFGRVDGRWWYQVALGYHRFARRRRRVAAELVAAAISAGPVSPHLVWLRTLAPQLRVRAVSAADPGRVGSATVGVADDAHGWFAVVAVPDGPTGPLVGELAELTAEVSGAQAILRSDGRVGWVAVRLSAVDAAGQYGLDAVDAVDAVIRSGGQRAVRILRDLGFDATLLDPAGLLAALVQANRLDGPPQEYWSHWRSGGFRHAFFVARDWPARLVLATPGVNVSVAVGAGRGWEVLVRVSGRPGALGPACRELTRAADRAGVRLRRLDGEHAPAAYACSPTGAGRAFLDLAPVARSPLRRPTSLGSTAI